MRIALLAFDGFDELELGLLSGLLNRLSTQGWKAEVASVAQQITSINGVTLHAPQPLEYASEADAVVFVGNIYARAMAENSALLDRLQIDPVRQLVGAQGSGSLLLARLGLLGGSPACADAHTKPWLTEAGVRVVEEPFHAGGPVATAGGGLAATYLAAWLMLCGAGEEAAAQALQSAAPGADREGHAEQLLQVVRPFVPQRPPAG
jgi:transcriptional regulator GlxA family with amidase domain